MLSRKCSTAGTLPRICARQTPRPRPKKSAGPLAVTFEVNKMSKPRTIIESAWDAHVVSEQAGAPTLLFIDLHLVHEVTSPQAFAGLRARGLKVRRPDLTFATVDHSTPT